MQFPVHSEPAGHATQHDAASHPEHFVRSKYLVLLHFTPHQSVFRALAWRYNNDKTRQMNAIFLSWLLVSLWVTLPGDRWIFFFYF